MSQANVEIIRRFYDAMARRDYATVFALHDPEVVMVNSAKSPETAPYVGHDGLRAWTRSVREAVGDFNVEADEIIDMDPDRVVVVGRVCGKGASSGLGVEVCLTTVYTLRCGKIVTTQSYDTKSEALEAVGLRE